MMNPKHKFCKFAAEEPVFGPRSILIPSKIITETHKKIQRSDWIFLFLSVTQVISTYGSLHPLLF
jgi:hypothetical protein